MIFVNFEIEDLNGRVIDRGGCEFESPEEFKQWMKSQESHPFLILKVASIEEVCNKDEVKINE